MGTVGPGRDYAFAQFLEDARDVGLNVDSTFSSWDLRPFAEGSEFIVGGSFAVGGAQAARFMADKSGGAHPGFVQDAHHRIFSLSAPCRTRES